MRKMQKLVKWLEGERYGYFKDDVWIHYGEETDTTSEFEKEHLYEISRNRMINKTIKHIKDEL